MNLEGIMLSEISQPQKDTFMIPLHTKSLEEPNSERQKVKWWVAFPRGVGSWGSIGTEFGKIHTRSGGGWW